MAGKRTRRWIAVLTVLVTGTTLGLLIAYRMVFGAPLDLARNEGVPLFIGEEISADSLRVVLMEEGWLDNTFAWDLTCRLMHFEGPVRPGHYLLDGGQSTVRLLRRFRSGWQDPIRVTFHGVRLKHELAARLASQLLLDSAAIADSLSDERFLSTFGLNTHTALSIFIPNTYELYWTTDMRGLFERMEKEFDAFWNARRLAKAAELELTPTEVGILASIVQEETNKRDEMSRVAGVYVNRLRRGMALQADPTARFARGDFSIRRVLEADLRILSPYNTYEVTGLPPGPITVPEPYVIDAVLEYEHHDYLFMCARDDLSGYHAFARTNAQHEANARAYHRALDRERIFR